MGGTAKAPVRANGRGEITALTRDREQHFRAMFEGAAIGICTCNLNGQITEGNAALSKMLGYRREGLAGLHMWELYRDNLPADRRLFSELEGGTEDFLKQERYFRLKNGECLWAQLTVSTVRDAEGNPSFLIAMLEDATESKRNAERSRTAEKMEVIGRLAGGIAHDFNNLLTGVLLYCDLLSEGIERGSRLLRHVQEIRLAGEQGAALTQQLLAIARKQVPQPRPILLNEVVSSTENMLRRLIGEQIELVIALAADPRPVLADEAQLRQVLLNLVLNARDAMPHGGRITVSTKADRRFGGGHGGVSLMVEDTGCGMDDDTRARLFEPFFTTKSPGHGTGLGLVTVKRIVSEAGGTIGIKSETGLGTGIEVTLPAIEASPAAGTPQRSRAGQTILLVDDHSSARNSIQRVLHHAGYRVLQASGGRRAMKVFAESEHRVDLLIADWMMPGMSGQELVAKLRQQNSELRVLLISGYHNPKDAKPDLSVELIRKPFASSALIERVREVLDRKGDS